jgi:phosphoglycolate phosphatase
MLKAIIFDLDGTLCDTMGDLQKAMNEMLRSFGWKERSREELLRFINRGARMFVAQSMPEGSWQSVDDAIVSEALEKYNECYAGCCGEDCRPYDGMTEALAALSGRYRLGVLSNKQHPFVGRIIETTFPGVFSSVHGDAPGFARKPDPRSLDRLTSELCVSPEECAFVGDSDIDMLTANNSGMLPVGVLWGYRDRAVLEAAGASVLVAEPRDLVTVFKDL